MNTFNQEATGLIDNPSYSNLEWLHNQDFNKEVLLSPIQEPTWIQNHQYQSLIQKLSKAQQENISGRKTNHTSASHFHMTPYSDQTF